MTDESRFGYAFRTASKILEAGQRMFLRQVCLPLPGNGPAPGAPSSGGQSVYPLKLRACGLRHATSIHRNPIAPVFTALVSSSTASGIVMSVPANDPGTRGKDLNLRPLGYEHNEVWAMLSQSIDGEIRDAESKVIVGRVCALLIQVGRVADAGENLLDIMDGESSELGKYHCTFFKSDQCDYNDCVRQQFDDIYGLDLLIINNVEIRPKFQKMGLGLLAITRTMDLFGENCGLVAIKPFPLQFRNYLDPDWLPPDGVENPEAAFRAATQKLRNYWARAGFKRVAGTDYYALCPARKRPSLKTIAASIQRKRIPV
jgi:hypothetical protein